MARRAATRKVKKLFKRRHPVRKFSKRRTAKRSTIRQSSGMYIDTSPHCNNSIIGQERITYCDYTVCKKLVGRLTQLIIGRNIDNLDNDKSMQLVQFMNYVNNIDLSIRQASTQGIQPTIFDAMCEIAKEVGLRNNYSDSQWNMFMNASSGLISGTMISAYIIDFKISQPYVSVYNRPVKKTTDVYIAKIALFDRINPRTYFKYYEFSYNTGRIIREGERQFNGVFPEDAEPEQIDEEEWE